MSTPRPSIRFHPPLTLLLAALAVCAVGGIFAAQTPTPPPRPDERPSVTVAVLGSSVAAGWVTSRETKHDLQNGWAARLGRLRETRGSRVVNVSVPGDDTTAVRARMGNDLASTGAEFVVIALSLGNEGIEEDRDAAAASFRAGLPAILEGCLDAGMMPVVGLCYASDGYDAGDYEVVRRTNRWIRELGLPCIDFLGAVDDGTGHFVAGHTYDEGHPDERGHEEMFLAVVPSLFEAMLTKDTPERPANPSPTIVRAGDGPAPLSWAPENVVHSFGFSFRYRTQSVGTISAVRVAKGWARISVDALGRITYTSAAGNTLVTGELDRNGEHHVTLSHRHLLGRTELFVDGIAIGTIEERLEPRQFLLGAGGDDAHPGPTSVALSDWLITRSPLGVDEVTQWREAELFPASLEVYAPLDAIELRVDTEVENRAQSLARVVARPADVTSELARLEEQIARARDERESAPLFPSPEIVEVEEELLEEYVGDYEIGPGDRMFVKRDGAALFLVDRGQEIRLHPLSEEEFFIRTVGEPRVRFERDEAWEVGRLVMEFGEQKVSARRVR